MDTSNDRHVEVHNTLRRFEQYSTLSPFCRIFYRMIYDGLGAPGLDRDKLDQAFHLFLRCERRRHEAVSHIVRQGKLDLLAIMRVGRDAHRNLLRICGAVEKVEPARSREAMIRQLLLAECNYHLGRTTAVIAALQRAIHFGCDHPVADFALGYNLYHSSIERYTKAGKRKGEVLVTDPKSFEETCRKAIRAFERGLGDTRFDAQICWWIGLISETIGERQDAYEAYCRAMSVDPDNFGHMANRKLRELGFRVAFTRSQAERERLTQLPPITEEEMQLARDHLAKARDFSTFARDSEDP